jgi:hypothetical protein
MPGILAAEPAESPCHQAIFMNDASSAITPLDAERVRAGDITWQRAKRRSLVSGRGAAGAYCKVPILAQDAHRGALVPDQGPVQQLASGKDRIVSAL